MKKFVSMVMTAAMVVSMVPATAFAAATGTATFKVAGAKEYKKTEAVETQYEGGRVEGPQLQIKVTDTNGVTGTGEKTTLNEYEVTLDFTGAELKADITEGHVIAKVYKHGAEETDANMVAKVALAAAAAKGDSSIDLKIIDAARTNRLAKDDVITIELAELNLKMTKTGEGSAAKVEVSGAFGKSDALTFASVLAEGVKVTLAKVAEVTEGEVTTLEKAMEIKPTIGAFKTGQVFKVSASSGFDLYVNKSDASEDYTITGEDGKVTIVLNKDCESFKVAKESIGIEAVSAKIGAVAKLTVKAQKGTIDGAELVGSIKGTANAVEAAKVIGSEVLLKVDAEEDVPVIYSGVTVNNKGISNDSDHMSLEVTMKESAKGALDVKKAFKLSLPEGVFVTKVESTSQTGTVLTGTADAEKDAVQTAFANAYKKGDQKAFEFARKTFVDTTTDGVAKAMEMKFRLELIAVPGFTGDVTLKLEGDAFENAQEVVIAKFVSPYTVEAQANDLVIDYRNTSIPTDVVIKEAEAGLWSNGLEFEFDFDKSVMDFEEGGKITADAESGMKLKDAKVDTMMHFAVKDGSDDVAATVTISDISLYMGREVAAGAYHLQMRTSAGNDMMTTDRLFTAAEGATKALDEKGNEVDEALAGTTLSATKPYYAADYADWSVKGNKFEPKMQTVKEGFVNVVTAGRDKDDASFTTKVVVPVGENKIIAGETEIALDVPAYINAAGYTMLPVRAVATALGINNDNVIWSQAAKQVTILYGQRIITMTVGEAMVYVNGSAIPASAAVEITDGRAFLGLRDLANALGVTTINWDQETKTATLN